MTSCFRVRRLKRNVLVATIFSFAMHAAPAAASTGCTAVNAGQWNLSATGTSAFASDNFVSGEVLSFSFSIGDPEFNNWSFSGSLSTGGTSGGGSGSSAAFTASTGSGSLTVNSNNPIVPGATARTIRVVSASCTPLPSTSLTVTSISPGTGSTVGGTSVTITGTNFTGVTVVRFGAANATSFTVNSQTQIVAISPAGSAGTVDVTVLNATGISPINAGDRFTYTAALGGTPASSGPLDSQRLQALQTSIAPLVAQNSGIAISTAIDGAIRDAFGSGGQFFNVLPGGMTFNFAAEPAHGGADGYARVPPSAIAQRANDTFAKALGNGLPRKSPSRTGPSREWSVWLDVTGSGWKVTDTSSSATASDVKGRQLNVTAGIGHMLAPNLLIGVLGGPEFFKYDVASFNGSLKGEGMSIGVYGARMVGNIRTDIAGVWSPVHYTASSGASTGSFTASRWLGTGALTGSYKLGPIMLQPSARLYILTEHQREWIDSLGTTQASRTFTSGRASTGAKVGQALDVNGMRLLPFIGVYTDYVFVSDNAANVGVSIGAIHAGWAARTTAGVGMHLANGAQLSLGGELGGLGANYKIWSGSVKAEVPF